MGIQDQNRTFFQKVRDYLKKPFVNIIDLIICQTANLKGHIGNHFVKEIVMCKLEEIPVDKVDDLPCRLCVPPGFQYGVLLDIDSV